MVESYSELIVECKDLQNGGTFPKKYTHKGDGISPEFVFKNLSPNGKAIAIVFDDLDHPMNHWIIWNIPLINIIPENLPENNIITEL
jgi:phosphatidylethanolamine-binding protein (PEBP) family uncharacterized protein